MKSIHKIEVDCANCANKIEETIKKIDGVIDCTVNFMTQKLILEIEENKDKEFLFKEIKKRCKKVESDVEIYF